MTAQSNSPQPSSVPAAPAPTIKPVIAAVMGGGCVLLIFGLAFALYLGFHSSAPSRGAFPDENLAAPPLPLNTILQVPANIFPATQSDPDNLAPISLLVSNGSLDDIAHALTSQLGVKFGSDPNPAPTRYNINLHNVSLWQVQEQLAKQHVYWSSPRSCHQDL